MSPHDEWGRDNIGCIPNYPKQTEKEKQAEMDRLRQLVAAATQQNKIRAFETGATRDSDIGKFDYSGFESALVSKRFAEYMDSNRKQKDDVLREADNWKKGIPLDSYAISLGRHMKDFELIREGFPEQAREDIETALCAILFNARGYLFELLRKKYNASNPTSIPSSVANSPYIRWDPTAPKNTAGYTAPQSSTSTTESNLRGKDWPPFDK